MPIGTTESSTTISRITSTLSRMNAIRPRKYPRTVTPAAQMTAPIEE